MPRAKAQRRKGGFPQFMVIFLCTLALGSFSRDSFLKNGGWIEDFGFWILD